MAMRCCRRMGIAPKRRYSGSTTASAISSVTPRGSTVSGAPPFDALLADKVPQGNPWTSAVFLDFLESELNEENLYFYFEIEALKALQGSGNEECKLPEESLLLLPKDEHRQEKLHELAKTLVKEFVEENAPHQVNISHEQRSRLLTNFEQALQQNGHIDAALFLEAQGEVKKLMLQDSWPRFVKRVLTENVAEWDRKMRLKKGIFWTIFVLLGVGLFLGFLVPRWYLFLFLLPINEAVDSYTTYTTKLCVANAFNNRFDIFNKKGHVESFCPIVRKSTKYLARRQLLFTATLAISITLFFFALTYIIDAGVGKNLYG